MPTNVESVERRKLCRSVSTADASMASATCRNRKLVQISNSSSVHSNGSKTTYRCSAQPSNLCLPSWNQSSPNQVVEEIFCRLRHPPQDWLVQHIFQCLLSRQGYYCHTSHARSPRHKLSNLRLHRHFRPSLVRFSYPSPHNRYVKTSRRAVSSVPLLPARQLYRVFVRLVSSRKRDLDYNVNRQMYALSPCNPQRTRPFHGPPHLIVIFSPFTARADLSLLSKQKVPRWAALLRA